MDLRHIQLSLDWHANSQSFGMCPSLYHAARNGPIPEVLALLGQQAADQATGRSLGRCDILEESPDGGNTVLHLAADHGRGDLILQLRNHFSSRPGMLSHVNSALETPLHCAARAGSLKAVNALVERTVNILEILRCKNEAGDTALHLAARHGHEEVVGVLAGLAAGLAAEPNHAGVSPLYLAVMSGSVGAVKKIITTCRDVASSAGPSSQNALHAAVFKSKDMVEELLKWKPVLADEGDSSGSSPLHFASSDGDWAIVKAILKAAPPSTVYKKDSVGMSALHVAAGMGHVVVVKYLLEHCPNAAELRDVHGRTFLHTAAMKKHVRVVFLAIRMFRTPRLLDAQDSDGNTALHLAVKEGAPRVVDALLWKGKAQPDVLNNDGHTPFDLISDPVIYLTQVSLVVTLVTFGAHTRPRRKDNLKLLEGSFHEAIKGTTDSLVVVAGLIATAGFAAAFNLPGGYNDNGMAHLDNGNTFICFLAFDTLAVAASVLAAILLVYSKATGPSDSLKSFFASLHCMWVSLVSLMLAFNAAAYTTLSTRGWMWAFVVLQLFVQLLIMWILNTFSPGESLGTTFWFLWKLISSPKARRVINREYPLAGFAMPNFILFMVTSILAFGGFAGLLYLRDLDRSRSS